jgi:hypothetical protein
MGEYRLLKTRYKFAVNRGLSMDINEGEVLAVSDLKLTELKSVFLRVGDDLIIDMHQIQGIERQVFRDCVRYLVTMAGGSCFTLYSVELWEYLKPLAWDIR